MRRRRRDGDGVVRRTASGDGRGGAHRAWRGDGDGGRRGAMRRRGRVESATTATDGRRATRWTASTARAGWRDATARVGRRQGSRADGTLTAHSSAQWGGRMRRRRHKMSGWARDWQSQGVDGRAKGVGARRRATAAGAAGNGDGSGGRAAIRCDGDGATAMRGGRVSRRRDGRQGDATKNGRRDAARTAMAVVRGARDGDAYEGGAARPAHGGKRTDAGMTDAAKIADETTGAHDG